MGEKTHRNLYEAFVGEAKAHFRLLAYAEKAEEEELPQIAALFRAVAEAERVHTIRSLRLLGEVVVEDSQANLLASFQREEKASGVFYPRFIQVLLTFVIPYGFMSFYPAQYFLQKNDFLLFFPWFQYLTPVVGAVLLTLAVVFWKAGLRRYQSTGS